MEAKKMPQDAGTPRGRDKEALAEDSIDATERLIKKANEEAQDAYSWIALNQDAFVAYAAYLVADSRAGRRASHHKALELVRAKAYTDEEGGTTKTPNALNPFLVRIVATDHPEIVPHLALNSSIADRAALHSAKPLLDAARLRAYESGI